MNDITRDAIRFALAYTRECARVDRLASTKAGEIAGRGVPLPLAIWRAYDRYTSNARHVSGDRLHTRTTAQAVRPTTYQQQLAHILTAGTVPPAYQYVRLPWTARGEQVAGKPSARSKARAGDRTLQVTARHAATVDRLRSDLQELARLYSLYLRSRGQRRRNIRSQLNAVARRVHNVIGIPTGHNDRPVTQCSATNKG